MISTTTNNRLRFNFVTRRRNKGKNGRNDNRRHNANDYGPQRCSRWDMDDFSFQRRPNNKCWLQCVVQRSVFFHFFSFSFSLFRSLSWTTKAWILALTGVRKNTNGTNLCTSLQTDNHSKHLMTQFLQAGCSPWRPTNRVKALKAKAQITSTF